MVQESKLRFDLGNPPGKNKSYGDALNWESLLKDVDDDSDLYFIADDKDYFSEIDSSSFNKFLLKEWNRKKGTNIKFYKTLSDFFKDIFPDIKLATELEKDLLITNLEGAGNFYNPRRILQKLSKFETFSTEQSNQILTSSLSNNQIFWISDDEDINEMLYSIVDNNIDKIDDDLLLEFNVKIKRLNPALPPPPPPPPF